jgi:GNAT superfamily N-acetyltransferase
MRFLLDTNVVIALEPTAPDAVEPGTAGAIDFAKLAAEGKHELTIHPAIEADYNRDPRQARRDLRRLLSGRYTELADPPHVPVELTELLGEPVAGSNDWVDNQLLAALADDRVDVLVTEDQGVHRKARRLGLSDRVLGVSEAASALRSLFDTAPVPPPHVELVRGHMLDKHDPIFDSFRADYTDFDGWLRKVRTEQRDAWVIRNTKGQYAAVAIVQPKKDGKLDLPGKVLKVCSFKVQPEAAGLKFGELLLKTVFDHCYANNYGGAYLTAFPRHEALIALAEEFGFVASDATTPRGEILLRKRFVPSDGEGGDDALDFHVQFGPRALHRDAAVFIVPIQPRFHGLLFPETEPPRLAFDEPQPYGNAIRKAYLCHAKIERLRAGATLLFYKSKSKSGTKTTSVNEQSIQCVGVVERVVRSQSVETIAREVGRRTVYRYADIDRMTRDRPVLAILFRHAITMHQPIKLAELRRHELLGGAPQSIAQARTSALEWARKRILE